MRRVVCGESGRMRYEQIDSSLFVENRKRLLAQLKPNSLVVLHSNDILPTNADGTLPFYQNSDLLYLSGVDQEESILVLAPDAAEEKHKEMLFLKETSELIAIWDGQKLTKNNAISVSGIQRIHWLEEFEIIFQRLMIECENIYLSTNEHARGCSVVETQNDRFIKRCQHQFPLHAYQRLSPIMHDLRSIKSDIEIQQLDKACRITENGFRRILGFVQPGVKEYEIEAEFSHEFLKSGSKGFAYHPIIAGGINSCVLHYIDNDQVCQDGDMLLLDVGAEYANYNADMTRTIPVNGKFTARQKSVYNAVLRVMRAGSDMLRPGVMLKDYQEEIAKLVEAELIGLGLLEADKVKEQNPAEPLYKKYFMHGTAHHLGLDVHDVGITYQPMRTGMLFTVEPGIYIREENFGVRLENNVLIGEEKNTDLMDSIPIEAEEIEELMNA